MVTYLDRENGLSECPSDAELDQFFDSTFSYPFEHEVQSHLENCPHCELKLTEMDRNMSTFDSYWQATEPGSYKHQNQEPVDLSLTGIFSRLRNSSRRSSEPNLNNIQLYDYELLGVLGRGGNAVVFEAVEKSTQRRVAIKVINTPHLLTDQEDSEILRRFDAEIAAASRIEHDNVVTVYSANKENGIRYLVMQMVKGPTLADLVRQGLEHRQAAKLIAGAALGVAAAHDHGVLHRDIKPSNILIASKNNRALVSDFGLAKLENYSVEAARTRTNSALGTLDYISPEQLNDASTVDQGTDIYGLGATLYYCLTGRPPYYSESIAEQIRQLTFNDPIPPSQVAADVPQDLEAICLKCLEKSKTDRYSTANDLSLDLTRFLQGKPTSARPAGYWDRSFKWIRRNKGIAALSCAALISCFAATAILAVSYARQAKSNALLALKNNELEAVVLEKEQANDQLKIHISNEQRLREKADANLAVAMDATTALSTRITESRDFLRNVDGTQLLRKEMLTTAKAQIDSLLIQQETPTLIYSLNHLRLSAAQHEIVLANYDDAIHLLNDVVADAQRLLLQPLINVKISHQDIERQICSAGLVKGNILFQLNKTQQASEILTQAWNKAFELHQQTGSLKNKRILMQIGASHSKILERLGNKKESEDILVTAWNAAKQTISKLNVAVKETDDPELRSRPVVANNYKAAITVINEYWHFNRFRDSAEAEAALREATKVIQELPLAELSPMERNLRAGMFMNYAIVLKSFDPEEAFSMRRRAAEEFRLLAKLNPQVPKFRNNAAKAIRNLANANLQRGETKLAYKLLSEAELLLKPLVLKYPSSNRYLESMSLVKGSLANYHFIAEAPQLAQAAYQEKLRIAESILSREPESQRRIYGVGYCHFQLAELAIEVESLWEATSQWFAASHHLSRLEDGGAKKNLNGKLRKIAKSIIASAAQKILLVLWRGYEPKSRLTK